MLRAASPGRWGDKGHLVDGYPSIRRNLSVDSDLPYLGRDGCRLEGGAQLQLNVIQDRLRCGQNGQMRYGVDPK